MLSAIAPHRLATAPPVMQMKSPEHAHHESFDDSLVEHVGDGDERCTGLSHVPRCCCFLPDLCTADASAMPHERD